MAFREHSPAIPSPDPWSGKAVTVLRRVPSAVESGVQLGGLHPMDLTIEVGEMNPLRLQQKIETQASGANRWLR